jgi:Na+/proline symporter
MVIKVSALCAYFLVVLAIGFLARTRWKSSPDTYFLADRRDGAFN